MDTETQKLVSEIEAHCVSSGIKPSTFATKVAGDGKFVKRLRAGGQTTLGMAAKIRAAIASSDEPAPAPPPSETATEEVAA